MSLHFVSSSVSSVKALRENSIGHWTESRLGEFCFCHLLALCLSANYLISDLYLFIYLFCT